MFGNTTVIPRVDKALEILTNCLDRTCLLIPQDSPGLEDNSRQDVNAKRLRCAASLAVALYFGRVNPRTVIASAAAAALLRTMTPKQASKFVDSLGALWIRLSGSLSPFTPYLALAMFHRFTPISLPIFAGMHAGNSLAALKRTPASPL